MGLPPLSSFFELEELSKWAYDNGTTFFCDLSSWDQNGRWNGWRTIHPPEHMKIAEEFLFTLLHGMAPINRSSKDISGWGKNGNYMVKEIFKMLISDITTTPEIIWKKVWQLDCIPKVNSFFWLLMHNKLLTAENLRKRGIPGPSG